MAFKHYNISRASSLKRPKSVTLKSTKLFWLQIRLIHVCTMQIKLEPLRQIKNSYQVYLTCNLTFEILVLKHKSHVFITWRFRATAALTLDNIWLVHILSPSIWNVYSGLIHYCATTLKRLGQTQTDGQAMWKQKPPAITISYREA